MVVDLDMRNAKSLANARVDSTFCPCLVIGLDCTTMQSKHCKHESIAMNSVICTIRRMYQGTKCEWRCCMLCSVYLVVGGGDEL